MKGDGDDPKALIREAYRIPGITAEQCRSIFLDWALSLPAERLGAARAALLLRYAPDAPDHPMTALLHEAGSAAGGRGRRGGWRARRNPEGETQ